jgi:hypothetical protein
VREFWLTLHHGLLSVNPFITLEDCGVLQGTCHISCPVTAGGMSLVSTPPVLSSSPAWSNPIPIYSGPKLGGESVSVLGYSKATRTS